MKSRSLFRQVVHKAVDLGGRVPPFNNEAEAAVLSAVLSDGRALDAVLEFLRPEHFYSDANRRVFVAAIELQRVGTPVDFQTVADWLKSHDQLQQVGGVSYLVKLVDATPAVTHVAAHAKIIERWWIIRQGIEACQIGAAEGYTFDGDAEAYLESIEQRIYSIERTKKSANVSLVYDLVKGEFERMNEALRRAEAGESSALTGLCTGFTDLDEMTSGMHDGELVIVAGRPGMGKSSYALNVGVNVAAREPDVAPDGSVIGARQGVIMFSLEMPKEQFAMRLLCSEGRVDTVRARKNELTPAEWTRYNDAANALAKLPIWIDDTSAITLLQMRAIVRRIQADFDKPARDGRPAQRIGLVIVDYLQLMRGRDNAQSREQEISEISRGLKAFAKDLRIPIIALAQLNRDVEKRSTKERRPQLSDLRDSGALEQDADVVQFLFRPEYYVADKESDEARKLKGYAEIIVAKQRNGPTDRVKVSFVEYCTRFENRAREAWGGEYEDQPAPRPKAYAPGKGPS